MPTFSNIDIEESATVTAAVGAISLTRNSSAELQEILVLGDPEVASSLGLTRVVNTAPASTMAGAVVRIASGPSSVADFAVRAILPSTATDNVVNVSSLAGRALVDQNSTVWPVQVSSVAGRVLADQNSTVWQAQVTIKDSSGVNVPASTSMPVNGAVGLNIRQVFPTLLSTAFSTIGNNSTSSTIVSSVAAQRVKVYAYSVTSTHNGASAPTLSFASSLANPIWHLQLRALSSGISGANLAVTPPAWLFATETANPLVFKVTGTTGTFHLSFSYFQEA